ncbi:hypothetical protein [Streptomyces sp. NPDC058745]|uniref:hypothetical protein n=1 Tax=unclassified Streptomyces TaxID=2593676 RepID=UPI00368856A8
MGDQTEENAMPAKPVRPRRSTWIWVSVLVTLCCGGPLALLVWGALAWSSAGDATGVSCTEAMDFARGSLPASAGHARCTEAHWQETRVTADFLMPRGEVADWLAATYPAGEPPYSCAGDLCLKVSYDEALYVDVRVTYEDADTAHVRLSAFDT